MARGQAFETMMLVISVIVALAILGVLLSILGVINPGQFGSDPRSTLKENLRTLQSRGYGIIQPKKVTFNQEGDTITRQELVSDLSILASTIEFSCAEPEICGGGDAPLDVSDRTIKVLKKIGVYIVTCANEQNSGGPLFCASIASSSSPAKATEDCTQKCGVEV